ncbi:BUD22 family protein [Schizosaccharomyces cryophilus OY26]|uniref:BUD22 family protein n=1 Tax=Schizosaccharomyces cryophilus (strain OY26 / ATCC MYA-4695 / CBS 11777 / NBRC 106824 / NRRL Y48691) TaxID=653667 RepID=S9XFR5_SCHCR|nr:BUD22 family protein [Schizosaccharomyces cryophilus OY26]EPY52481.1 BUD22 family protein [Schizosaccharomyces cryophilus OY26]
MKHTSNKTIRPKSSKPRLSPELLQKRTHHFKKQLTHALKKAVGFERQKLARRIKSARAQEENDKKYDFSKLTEFCFYRKVLRNKDYRNLLNEHKPVEFPADITNDEEKNVIARLLNSKPVLESVDASCRLLDKCISINNPEAGSTKATDQNLPLKAEAEIHPEPLGQTSLKSDKPETESKRIEQTEGLTGQKELEQHEVSSKPSVSSKYDASVDQPHEMDTKHETPKASSQEDVNRENGQDINKEDSDMEDEMFTIPATKSLSYNLPELATGFLDPLGEDDEFVEKEMDEIEIPKRKNRRGQRARQAIWEKKFGKGANHIIKKKEQEQQEREERQRKFEEREAKRARKVAMAQQGVGSRSSQEAEKLHPSWEARKKQKLPPAAPFQGKKFVFE